MKRDPVLVSLDKLTKAYADPNEAEKIVAEFNLDPESYMIYQDRKDKLWRIWRGTKKSIARLRPLNRCI
jgi:hypothetical protein